jgi:hypothetical protein
LLYFLQVVGADRDEHGRFIIVDGGAFAFLGIEADDNDIVVDEYACYLIGGQRCGLASGLGQTSYGMRVNVIA